MSRAVDKLASVLLYEGFVASRGHAPWSFGSLLPRTFSEEQSDGDPWWMRTECLLRGGPSTRISVSVRLLHLRHLGHLGQVAATRDADERVLGLPTLTVSRLLEQSAHLDFGFPDRRFSVDGEGWWQEEIAGSIDVRLAPVSDGVYRLAVRVENRTPLPAGARREVAELRALAAPHALLAVDGGEFCSLLDPPGELRGATAACNNVGVWPVLIGPKNDRSTMMASPIILYDHPRLAPESAGDLFDSAELKEVLSLRVRGIHDDEKRDLTATDRMPAPRARDLVDRTDEFGPETLGRPQPPQRSHPLGLPRAGTGLPRLAVGASVRLHPRGRGDVFDLVLAEARATVVAVEQDARGRTYYAVTVDDDPGRELGVRGLPGHRFYFQADEVEPC